MGNSNNLPKAISHKKLSSLMLNAKKDKFSSKDDLSNIELQEFEESLKNWDKNTVNLLQKISSKNKKLLDKKSTNAIMALGAMEVHLNMALQALKVFMKDTKD